MVLMNLELWFFPDAVQSFWLDNIPICLSIVCILIHSYISCRCCLGLDVVLLGSYLCTLILAYERTDHYCILVIPITMYPVILNGTPKFATYMVFYRCIEGLYLFCSHILPWINYIKSERFHHCPCLYNICVMFTLSLL